jgi:hypothetical protein
MAPSSLDTPDEGERVNWAEQLSGAVSLLNDEIG